MRTLYRSLYAKVRAQIAGLLAGGALAAAVTGILNAADTTDLSASQQGIYTLATAALLGLLNAYRRPEDHDPIREHHTPGA